MLAFAAAGPARSAEPAVVVTDFEIPAAQSNAWGWARAGLADLFQQTLSSRGVVVVDRDSLRAVESEQHLAAGGLTGADHLRVGALLGAKFVVGGSVAETDGEKARVDVWLSSVEAIEKLASASAEGPWRKELPSMLEKLGDQLLQNGTLKPTQRPDKPAGLTIRPEALMFFYEGVNACARRQPTLAVAHFLRAYNMDTNFVAARAWEARAYELAGLPEFAHGLRSALAKSAATSKAMQAMGPDASSSGAVRRVVSLLPPLLAGDEGGKAAELRSALERALLASGRVRLFGAESIRSAVTEQDQQLNALFDQQGVARYGKWLVADGLLECRGLRNSAGLFQVRLVVLDPLGGGTRAEVNVEADSAADSKWGEEVGKLLDAWSVASTGAAARDADKSAPEPLSTNDLARLSAHQDVVQVLDEAVRVPAGGRNHRKLAEIFAREDQAPLALLEAEAYLDGVLRDAKDKEHEFSDAALWTFGYCREGEFPGRGELAWDVSYSKGPPPAPGTFGDKVRKLVGTLQSDYPDSLATATTLMAIAYNAHPRTRGLLQRYVETAPGRYESTSKNAEYFLPKALESADIAVTYAHKAADILWRMAPPTRGTEVGSYGDLCIPNLAVIEGTNLLRLGRTSEAMIVLEKAAAGFRAGLYKESFYMKDAEAQIFNMLGARPDPLRLKNMYMGPDAEWRAAERDLANYWDTEAANPAIEEPIAVEKADSVMRHEGDVATRKLMIDSYMRRTGLADPALAMIMTPEVLITRLGRIIAWDEGRWDRTRPFLSPPYPPEIGLRIMKDGGFTITNRLAVMEVMEQRGAIPSKDLAAVWQRIAAAEAAATNNQEAWRATVRAFTNDIATDYAPYVFMAAVERNPESPKKELPALASDLGLNEIPALPASRWFDAGRMCQKGHKLVGAVSAFSYYLQEAPSVGATGESEEARDMRLNAKFRLAECLAVLGHSSEAAALAREVALALGDAKCTVYDAAGRDLYYMRGMDEEKKRLGLRAAALAEKLHQNNVKESELGR